MKMSLTGHGPPGDDYFVRVHVRLRVCAVRGRSEVVVNETLRVGGQTFGEHTRTIRFCQRSRCEAHRFRWRLRDEFFGVGTYRVAATVWDRAAQFSKTVTRKQSTLD
jgi:sirohydrochlorin ferrochelatase